MPMNKHQQITFRSVEEALEKLNAEDKGHYYICNCPECQQHEAFMYKNNLNYIQCNRENHCGERMILQYHKKQTPKELQQFKLKQAYPSLNKEQVQALDWAKKAYNHMQRYFPSKTLDSGYRGLSKEVARDFMVDLQHEGLVQFMFQKTEPLLGKAYANNEWMCQRNLVFPLYGEDNTLDRILLRSSINPDLEPKEIQLIMNPSKDTRDFFMDIPKNAKTVVVTESILDGLSFREMDANVGFIALTGASKTRKVMDYLEKYKEALRDTFFLLAMDDDEAGWEANQKVAGILENARVGRDWNVFSYHEGIKDPNEFLQADRERFKKQYIKSIAPFKTHQRKREAALEMEL